MRNDDLERWCTAEEWKQTEARLIAWILNGCVAALLGVVLYLLYLWMLK